jgi:hypothetical protein
MGATASNNPPTIVLSSMKLVPQPKWAFHNFECTGMHANK